MLRILLLVVIPLTLLWGCTNKSAKESITPQSTGCLLLTESLNSKPFRTHEYNANSLLYRIVQYSTSGTPAKRYTFDYDEQDRVTVFRETNLVAPFVNYQYTPFYSSQSRIDSISYHRITNSGLVPLENYKIEYDSEKRISKYSWKNNYWRFEYDKNNNLAKWFKKTTETTNTEMVAAEFGNYDGKRSSYATLQPYKLLSLVNGNTLSSQNPGTFKYYNFGSDPTQTGVVTYLYNEKDQPIEAVLSIFTPSLGSNTQVYKFTYQCL